MVVKGIFKHFIGTQGIGLSYPRDNFELIGYSKVDFAGCKVDRKSTSKTCQLLGNKLISWFFKKQNLVALSTVESEYITVSSCCAQVL